MDKRRAYMPVKGKKFDEMTKEELAECGRIGGTRSGESKRNKKTMKELLEVLLSMPLKNKKCYDVDEIKDFAALKGKNIDVQTAILVKQIQNALMGDRQSAEFVRDTAGHKPKDSIDVSGSLPVVIMGGDVLAD